MAGAQPICEKARAVERAGLTRISPTHFVAGPACAVATSGTAPTVPPAARAVREVISAVGAVSQVGRDRPSRAPATDGVLPRLGAQHRLGNAIKGRLLMNGSGVPVP
jgi:hypothetical protein